MAVGAYHDAGGNLSADLFPAFVIAPCNGEILSSWVMKLQDTRIFLAAFLAATLTLVFLEFIEHVAALWISISSSAFFAPTS